MNKKLYKNIAKIHPSLSKSWTSLLFMGSLCALLAVFIVFQIAMIRPVSQKAYAIKSVIIPDVEIGKASDGFQYRHLISQLVHSSKKYDFFEGRDLSDLIIRVSIEENIDPLFIAAIVKAESTFSKQVLSSRGAYGLMQIKPSTAQYVSTLVDETWEDQRFEQDPEYNLRLGILYLKYLSKKFDGDLFKILAAYNWGPGNVKKLQGNYAKLPSSTKKYVSKIIQSHQRWKQLIEQS